VFPDRFPSKARTHSDVLAIEWSVGLACDQIHTPLCFPLQGRGLFGRRHFAYPHIPLFAECLLSTPRRYRQTGGCPWPARLEPLPPSHCRYNSSGFTASADAVEHLTSLDRPRYRCNLSPSRYALFYLVFGLGIRLMVDGHYPRLCLPTCPRFPLQLTKEAARLRWRVHFSPHLKSPFEDPKQSDHRFGLGLHGFSDLFEVGRCGTYPHFS